MSGDETVERLPFKLAFRVEGTAVNCYLAPVVASLGETRLLSTMPRRVCEADKQIFDDWKELMKRVLAVMMKGALGIVPVSMIEEEGPPDERTPDGSGH